VSDEQLEVIMVIALSQRKALWQVVSEAFEKGLPLVRPPRVKKQKYPQKK
jgi:hypothetical protein